MKIWFSVRTYKIALSKTLFRHGDPKETANEARKNLLIIIIATYFRYTPISNTNNPWVSDFQGWTTRVLVKKHVVKLDT